MLSAEQAVLELRRHMSNLAWLILQAGERKRSLQAEGDKARKAD